MAKKTLTPPDIVILASGAVAFVFSFLPFYSAHGYTTSAWSTGLFPVATLVPIFGLLMAAHIIATRLLGAHLPERVLDFTWEQIHIVLGVMSALLMSCYLIVGKGGFSFGFGFFLAFLAAFGLAAGAFLQWVESRRGEANLSVRQASAEQPPPAAMPPQPASGTPYPAPPSGPGYPAPPSGTPYPAPPSAPGYPAPPSGPGYPAPPSGPGY
jgi:hypothetical protein